MARRSLSTTPGLALEADVGSLAAGGEGGGIARESHRRFCRSPLAKLAGCGKDDSWTRIRCTKVRGPSDGCRTATKSGVRGSQSADDSGGVTPASGSARCGRASDGSASRRTPVRAGRQGSSPDVQEAPSDRFSGEPVREEFWSPAVSSGSGQSADPRPVVDEEWSVAPADGTAPEPVGHQRHRCGPDRNDQGPTPTPAVAT